jgi:hypothetical protein
LLRDFSVYIFYLICRRNICKNLLCNSFKTGPFTSA